MTKGRPPLNPRIEALEARVAALEKQIDAMNDSFNRGSIPQPKPYVPLFERWPGGTNGSP
jgi:hypothetical protein